MKMKSILSALLLGTAAFAATPALAQAPAKNIVLVHGAFADGSMWSGVIAELQAAGIGVSAAANPLRSLRSDAGYIAAAAVWLRGWHAPL